MVLWTLIPSHHFLKQGLGKIIFPSPDFNLCVELKILKYLPAISQHLSLSHTPHTLTQTYSHAFSLSHFHKSPCFLLSHIATSITLHILQSFRNHFWIFFSASKIFARTIWAKIGFEPTTINIHCIKRVVLTASAKWSVSLGASSGYSALGQCISFFFKAVDLFS